jgi:hypothetical protein
LLEGGELSPEHQVVVPLWTTPRFEILALHPGLGTLSAAELRQLEEVERHAALLFEPATINLPAFRQEGHGGCTWVQLANATEAPDKAALLVELSSIIANPFAQEGEQASGLFARLSLGGRAGSWYWIELTDNGAVATVRSLAVNEGV